MKKKAVAAVAVACTGLSIFSARAVDYTFPTGMTVSIEGETIPMYKENSNIVYPVVNYFMVKFPNGDEEFALRTEDGENLGVIKQGEKYFINSHIALGENVYFGPSVENVADPVRVMIKGRTDRAGGDSANLVLARKRADAAAAYLKKKLAGLGVMNPVIKTETMGEYLSTSRDGVVNLNDRKVSVLIYPTI